MVREKRIKVLTSTWRRGIRTPCSGKAARMAAKNPPIQYRRITKSNKVNKMNKFDDLITKSKLFTLEQQEWYLRNFRVSTETRKYIYKRFKDTMTTIFGDDADARDIIEELR